jgi:hypothetical protein
MSAAMAGSPGIGNHRGQGLGQHRVQTAGFVTAGILLQVRSQRRHHQLLHRVPAHEAVVVAARQGQEVLAAIGVVDAHRGRKAAQQRGNGLLRQARETETLLASRSTSSTRCVLSALSPGLLALEAAGAGCPPRRAVPGPGELPAGSLCSCPGVGGVCCDTVQRVASRSASSQSSRHRELRCAGLRIPAPELREIHARRRLPWPRRSRRRSRPGRRGARSRGRCRRGRRHRPSSVCSMRTTSAPFSYTVSV